VATITPELYLTLRRPSQATVTRDGRRVAFVLGDVCGERDRAPGSRVYVIEDGTAQPATRGLGQEALPEWSADGSLLAFASDHDHPGRFGLYVLRANGRADPVGDVAGSVEHIRWGARGEIFASAADLGADLDATKAALPVREQGAPEDDPKVIRPHVRWRRLYCLSADGDTREITPAGVNVWEFDANDSGTVVLLASSDPSEMGWFSPFLAVLDPQTTSVRRIAEPGVQVTCPRVSPSGVRVAYCCGFTSDRGIVAGNVAVVDLETGRETLPLTDLGVSWLQWRDDETLWYAGWRGMRSMFGLLHVDGRAQELWCDRAVLGDPFQPRVSAGDGVVVSVEEAPGKPPEVVRFETSDPERGWQPLTKFNAALTGFGRPRDERFDWHGDDGLELEGLLLTPVNADRPLPLVTIVHGGPTSLWSYTFATFLGESLYLTGAGYAVFLPNPRGSAGRGQAFARANVGDLGGGDFRDIVAGVDALVAAGVADPRRLAIMGASYGGYMTGWAVTQTDRFACGVAVACISNFASAQNTSNIGRSIVMLLGEDTSTLGGLVFQRSSVNHTHRCTTPTLVVHGAEDLACPVSQAHELYQALRDAGVETELVVYPREGHAILEREHQLDFIGRVHSWLERHLPTTEEKR
jgi:dipeptidyl aminopeptidase/acylaminoacyl peptidase